MSNQQNVTKASGVWMRMVYRYSVVMVIGIVLLAYVFPDLHEGAGKIQLIAVLLGGLLSFGGGFGLAISTFFHMWHKK